MQKKTIIYISVAVAVIALGLGGFFLWNIYSQGIQPEPVPPGGSSDETGRYYPSIPDVSQKLTDAIAENQDVVGWLMLPNTTVNEPVVQYTDNNHYLRRDYTGSYDFSGCYFVDYESVIADGGAMLSQNTIIYGHNLGNPQGQADDPTAAKFAQLLILQQEDVARQTPYVYFVTPAQTYVFEIFAAFYTESYMQPVPFHFSQYNEEEFSTLVQDAKARSTFLYDVAVSPADNILTLSTCTYKFGTYAENPNQRYVVMARQKADNEVFSPIAQITPNDDPKPPDF